MSCQFKFKPDKIKFLNTVDTLHNCHKKMTDTFKENKLNLPKKKQLLEQYNTELDNYTKNNIKDQDYINNRTLLLEKIEKLQEEITNIENNELETDYYSKTWQIILNYYDTVDGQLQEEILNQHKDLDQTNDTVNTTNDDWNIDGLDVFGSSSILEKLNNKSKLKRKEKKSTRKRIKNVESLVNNTNYDIFDFFDDDNKSNKNENVNNKLEYNVFDRSILYEDYKISLEGLSVKKKSIKICPTCNIEKTMIYNEGLYACIKCGEIEQCIIESEQINYKDPMIEKPVFPYKRKNHFCEWLSQFQAKESIEIPHEDIILIKNELIKLHFNTLNYTDIDRVKKILKSLKLNKYYEHIVYIISKITGKPAPTFSREIEEKLKKMFDQIQEPFDRHCPKDRINFLSYSYVFHKFIELLEMHDYIKCFPLLKSRTKLRYQDEIWKKICSDCNWKYYPSV